MSNSSAIHGWWCGAKTYPTRCSYCKEQVFYFSCKCGSKAFFQELGGSWPEHRCLEYLIAQYGKAFVEQGLALQMQRPGISIRYRVEPEYTREIERASPSAPSRKIKRVDACNQAVLLDVGVVREIIEAVDPFKKLRVEPGDFGKVLLGGLARGKYGQITLHVGDLSRADLSSYTCFIAQPLLHDLRLTIGEMVELHAQGRPIAGRDPVWVVVTISRPFPKG